MTANPMPVTVEGEPVEVLRQALMRFRFDGERDGLMHFSVKLPPELGDPFMRALMRIEAEFLLADADGLGRGAEVRTHRQRDHDALVELMRRIGAAVG